ERARAQRPAAVLEEVQHRVLELDRAPERHTVGTVAVDRLSTPGSAKRTAADPAPGGAGRRRSRILTARPPCLDGGTRCHRLIIRDESAHCTTRLPDLSS